MWMRCRQGCQVTLRVRIKFSQLEGSTISTLRNRLRFNGVAAVFDSFRCPDFVSWRREQSSCGSTISVFGVVGTKHAIELEISRRPQTLEALHTSLSRTTTIFQSSEHRRVHLPLQNASFSPLSSRPSVVEIRGLQKRQ